MLDSTVSQTVLHWPLGVPCDVTRGTMRKLRSYQNFAVPISKLPGNLTVCVLSQIVTDFLCHLNKFIVKNRERGMLLTAQLDTTQTGRP